MTCLNSRTWYIFLLSNLIRVCTVCSGMPVPVVLIIAEGVECYGFKWSLMSFMPVQQSVVASLVNIDWLGVKPSSTFDMCKKKRQPKFNSDELQKIFFLVSKSTKYNIYFWLRSGSMKYIVSWYLDKTYISIFWHVIHSVGLWRVKTNRNLSVSLYWSIFMLHGPWYVYISYR